MVVREMIKFYYMTKNLENKYNSHKQIKGNNKYSKINILTMDNVNQDFYTKS